MKRTIILFFSIFIFSAAWSQVEFPSKTASDSISVDYNTPVYLVSKNNINSSSAINRLLRKHIIYNQQYQYIKGYRVQIYFGSGSEAKQKALNIKSGFENNYSGYTAYITYDAPNFKVRVGDFRTKNEALKLYNKLKNTYLSAFIVQDNINLPPINTTVNYE